MKRKYLMTAALALAMAACSSAPKPRDILLNAFKKSQDLTSSTMTGTMNIGLKMDEMDLTIPADMVIKTDTAGTKDRADDRNYVEISMSLFGESLDMNIWMADGMMYIDDGTNKSCSEADLSTLDQPEVEPGVIIDKIFKDIDKTPVEKDGDRQILNLTIDKEGLLELYGELLKQSEEVDAIEDVMDTLEDAMEIINFDAFRVVVDKDGYVENVNTTASGNSEGVDMSIALDLTVSDRNSTVIPDFDPAEFRHVSDLEESLPAVDDVAEPEKADEEMLDDYTLEVEFDDGTAIRVHSPEEQGVYCYFDDEQQGLFFFNDETMLAQGLFLPLDLGEEIFADINGDAENYRIIDQGSAGQSGKALTAVALAETDIMEKDALFTVCVFPDAQLSLVVFGDGMAEEDFVKLMNGVVYTEL